MNKYGVILTVIAACSIGACRQAGSTDPASAENDVTRIVVVRYGTLTSPPASAPAATTSASAVPDRRYSAACPEGMREVSGRYCKSVEHRCLEGRDVAFSDDPKHPGGLKIQTTVPWTCKDPNGCAVPYYCDKFVEGYAVCGTKTVKTAHAAEKTVDDKPMRFCIDEYEYPNVIGEKPAVMVTWKEMKKSCEDLGKRLCDDDEWTLACEGPEHAPYTYGWKRDADACNIDRPYRTPNVSIFQHGSKQAVAEEVDRLNQSLPIGEKPKCVSSFGVHDMGGNVDEWANNVTKDAKPFKSIFCGGHWASGARNRCRPRTTSHNEDFKFYAEGGRCCANPKR